MVNGGRNGGETTGERHGGAKLGFGSNKMNEVSGERQLTKMSKKKNK